MVLVGSHLDIADPRGDDRMLRLSWHATRRVLTVSQWRDGICVSTTPVGLEQLAELAAFSLRVLTTVALDRPERAPSKRRSALRAIAASVRAWLRPRLAPVLALHERDRSPGARHRSSA